MEKQSHTTGDFCIEWHSSTVKKAGGPVVKTSPSSPESAGLISGQGTKIPRAMEETSLRAATTEPVCLNTEQLENLCTSTNDPSCRNKYYKKKI